MHPNTSRFDEPEAVADAFANAVRHFAYAVASTDRALAIGALVGTYEWLKVEITNRGFTADDKAMVLGLLGQLTGDMTRAAESGAGHA